MRERRPKHMARPRPVPSWYLKGRGERGFRGDSDGDDRRGVNRDGGGVGEDGERDGEEGWERKREKDRERGAGQEETKSLRILRYL